MELRIECSEHLLNASYSMHIMISPQGLNYAEDRIKLLLLGRAGIVQHQTESGTIDLLALQVMHDI